MQLYAFLPLKSYDRSVLYEFTFIAADPHQLSLTLKLLALIDAAIAITICYAIHSHFFFAQLFFIYVNIPLSTPQSKLSFRGVGEPLNEYISPDATVILASNPAAPEAKAGDIVIFNSRDISKIPYAIVQPDTSLLDLDTKIGINKRYIRCFLT